MKRRHLIFTCILLLFTNKSYSVIINTDNLGEAKISRSFYGVNISPHVPLPSPKILKELNIGMMRIGGNEFDAFNWENSFVYNPEYGYVKMQSIDSILTILEKSNIEPLLQINILGNMPIKKNGHWHFKNTFNLKHVTKLIKKFNSKAKTRIKNLSIGNEFDHWHDTHKYFFTKQKAISADDYINRYIATAIHIRDTQESINKNSGEIKIWGPEISTSYNGWQTENIDTDCKYTANGMGYTCKYGTNKDIFSFIPYFLKRLKNKEKELESIGKKYQLIDFLSFHYYPIFRSDSRSFTSVLTDSNKSFPLEKALASSMIFTTNIKNNTIDKSSHKEYTPNIFNNFKSWVKNYYPESKVALTEFGVDPDDRVKTYPKELRPLYFANVLGQAMNSNIAFINKFRLNSISPNIAPWSLIKDNVKTPLFYVLKLFTHNMIGRVLNTISEEESHIKVYSIKNQGYVNIIVLNMAKKLSKVSMKINKSKLNLSIKAYGMSLIKYNIKSKKHTELSMDFN